MKSDNNYRINLFAFLLHAVLLAVTATFTDINTVLPSLILGVGGTELHLGILTGIMIGMPLAGQLFFAGFLQLKSRKKPYLLAGIYTRTLSLLLLTLILYFGNNRSSLFTLLGIYFALLLFTLGGAFAGVSYMDLVGKSFEGERRKSFILRRQLVMSLGILLSAVITRMIFAAGKSDERYVLLFALSAGSLLFASIGFWLIREQPVETEASGTSVFQVFRMIPEYLKLDSTLRNYLITSNLLGFGTVLIPFYFSMGVSLYEFSTDMVGNLVLIQIVAMVISNAIWRRVVHGFGFKGMLRVWAVLGTVLPLIAFIIGKFLPFAFFLPLFVVSGFYLGAQKVTSDAVLLEISNNRNRPLYSGIVGTFNLSLAVFPILLGGLISVLGYFAVFVFVSLSAVAALPFIKRMICPVDLPSDPPANTDS